MLLPVKILTSPTWEERLSDCAAIFARRRQDLLLALSVHTAVAVNATNTHLKGVKQVADASDERNHMLLLFRVLDSPQERELMRIVSDHGGPQACMDDDKILKELVMRKQKLDGFQTDQDVSAQSADFISSQVSNTDPFEWRVLREQLHEGLEAILHKNELIFQRKLEVQKKQLVEELEDMVKKDGDRVISAIISGPHDRIIDSVSVLVNTLETWFSDSLWSAQDLHRIWKEMV